MSPYFNIFLLFTLLLYTGNSQAQTIDWPDYSDKTYVFEISDKEAVKLLKNPVCDNLVQQMLHSPVATFSKTWTNKPERGHFILANINKSTVTYRYFPEIPFQVFLFKEYGVLTLQVVDATGNIRKDAKVKLNNKRISYDNESRTYTLDDWSEARDRILTVKLEKFTAVFDLTKHLVNPWYNDDDYSHSPDFYSYMITDKNRYKPGEIVRFKSYALSANRRPLKNDLTLWLNYNKKLATVPAYHPGGFTGEFRLHDSLELRLDRQYSIQLRDQKDRIVASTQFQYEDYELYESNKLQIELESQDHYYPDTNRLKIMATDVNGLFLQGMKADVTVTRKNVLNTYSDLLILPDTLIHRSIDLDAAAPTYLDIPYGLFGQSNCEYKVEVLMFTFDNQRMYKSQSATYYYSNYRLAHDTHNDSIRFAFYKLGKEHNVQAELSYTGGKETKIVQLPYSEKFNQALSGYNIRVPEASFETNVLTTTVHHGLHLEGGFDKGTFEVKLQNPLQLDLSWYIYQGNTLLKKGSGKELDFKSTEVDWGTAYYAEIFYFMGDKEEVYRRVFTPKTDFLSVDINLPDRVYPGQKLDATISVTDHLGKPMPKVDLTAFAVNALLDYYVPDLPYYGKSPSTREQRANYSMRRRGYICTTALDYKFWNKLAHLDEMEYYQFAYPRGKFFTHKVNTPDGTAQFAPFVMKDGEVQKIYVIEVNDKPVYFSWTEQPKGYSFICPPGGQKIALRLQDRVLVLVDFNIEPGKKTIISIDLDYLPEGEDPRRPPVRTINMTPLLSSREVNRYKSLIARFPCPYGIPYALLTQKDTAYVICNSSQMRRQKDILVGPIPEGLSRYTGNAEYKHEGSYAYEFDGNVVYKSPTNVFPPSLNAPSYIDYKNINEFSLTPKRMAQLTDQQTWNEWHPRNICIVQAGMDMNFLLPAEKDSSGVAMLLFEDHQTGKIVSPARFSDGRQIYATIPSGTGKYNAIVLYNNGKYLKYEQVPLVSHSWMQVNMSKLNMHPSDSASTQWLRLAPVLQERSGTKALKSHTLITKQIRNYENIVRGYVYDEIGDPIPGVNVVIKGTTNGVITDIDGHFEIDIEGSQEILVFSFIGYMIKELNVTANSEIKVTLEEDQRTLEEVVVVGYGIARNSDESSAKADKTAPSEDVEDDEPEDNKADPEETLYNELLLLNGLRKNFSDVGFWEPRLYTDRKGKAQFSVTFPDNITRWDAVVYAMNRNLKTGTARRYIKSYKPLMAELKMPQFLTVGDTSYFSGSVRNYTKDPRIEGEVLFAMQGDTLIRKGIQMEGAYSDKLFVVGVGTDSITACYTFTRNDGYMDGEERSIPLEQQGTEVAKGSLGFLRSGDSLQFRADTGEEMQLKITGRQADIYMDATRYLTGYAYACNEQLASKLIGLLNYKVYAQYAGEEFDYDKNINAIIKRLLDNQNDARLWSWWGRSQSTSYWMSAHILRALDMAKKAGYTVNLTTPQIDLTYADIAPYKEVHLSELEIFHTLTEMGLYPKSIKSIELFENMIREQEHTDDSLTYATKNNMYPHKPASYLKEKLLLWEIRQQQNIGYVSDSIGRYLKRDILGAVYCDDGKRDRSWYYDKLSTTLIAYRIVKNDSALKHLVEPMQIFILGTKSFGWNTWQASSAVATVLPDLMAPSGSDTTPTGKGATKDNPATVLLSGKENKQLTRFPYETVLQPGEHLNLFQQSGMPLIYTAYSYTHVTEAASGDAFEIISSIENGNTLTAGQPVTLTVELKVKLPGAEHVMIEVPIPAACSYNSKSSYSGYYYTKHEVHREHFKEKTAIFCENLPIGTYRFNISLLPRFTGKYTLNPAKVELMYQPVINANNDMKKVIVDERK